MAEKRTIELEITDNTKSLKAQFKEAQAEVQRLADKYGATSEQAVEAAKNAAILKDKIGDAKALTDAFNPDAKFSAFTGTLTGVAGGFSAVTGAMGLMGTESENVQKIMLKVQSAMAIGQGLQAVGQSIDSFKQLGAVLKQTAVGQGVLTIAQTAYNFVVGAGSTALKLFRLALVSTGIGAIIVLVGVLIANFDAIVDSLSGVTDWLGITDTEAEKNAENERMRKDMAIENEKRLQEARERAYNSEQSQYDNKIKLLKAEGKSTYELEKAKIQGSIRYQQTLKKELELKLNELKINAQLMQNAGLDTVAVAMQKNISDIQNKISTATQAIASAETDLKILDINQEKAMKESAKKTAEQNKKNADASKKNADDRAKKAQESRKKIIEELNKQYEDELKLNEEKENQKLALMQEGIEKEKALRKDQFNDYRDNFLNERIKDETEALNKQFENGKISQQEYQKKLTDLRIYAETKLTEKEREILVNAKELLNNDLLKIDEKYEAEKKKLQEDAIKEAENLERKRKQDFDAQIEALDEENYQAGLTAQERELGAIREKYFAMEELAKGNADAEKTIAEAKGREIDAINKKYADEEAKRKKEAIDRNLDLVKNGLSLVESITELFGKKGEKEARRAFNVKKAAQIASATIDTYKNAVSAYGSQFVPIPDPSSPVRGGIAAGIAVTAGLVNIAKIASQKFEGGGASGGGGGGGGGGDIGGGASTTQAPSFNVVGNNGLNQLAQLQQQPTQAFVVSGDVTSAQSLERNRIQNATL